jgi:hypothetical protein
LWSASDRHDGERILWHCDHRNGWQYGQNWDRLDRRLTRRLYWGHDRGNRRRRRKGWLLAMMKQAAAE